MSFLVKVEGSESFEVAKECVRSVECKNQGRRRNYGDYRKDFSGFGRGYH